MGGESVVGVESCVNGGDRVSSETVMGVETRVSGSNGVGGQTMVGVKLLGGRLC